MDFHESIKKLESSEEFKKFNEENEKAYLCSGFFILDFETGINTQQMDFFLPDKNKMALFSISDNVNFRIEEIFGEKKKEIKKIDTEIKVEIPELEKIIKKEAKQKIKKIIATLQNIEDKQVWNCTCILESFNMMNIRIDCQSGEILKEEKSSLFDFAQFVKGKRKDNENKV